MCDGVTDDSVAGCALAQSIAVFHFLRSSFDVRSTFVRRSFVVPSSSFLRRRSFVVVRSTFVPSFLRRRSFVVPSSFLCRSFVDFVFRFVCCPFIRSFACLVLVVCRRLSPSFVQRRRLSAERHKKSYSFDLLLRVVIACGPVESSASPVSAALVESI